MWCAGVVWQRVRRFEAWPISFTPLCLCLSDETVKAVGSFCLVSMPGEVKDLTQGNGKKTTLEKDTLKNQEDHV